MNGPVQANIRVDSSCTSDTYKGYISRIQLNP
jgi:hypothetical protein